MPSFIGLFRTLFSKTDREHDTRCRNLMDMPKDRQAVETAAYLYEQCARQASAFVQEELQKQDSPFKGASNSVLFHELLAVTFWLMDKMLFKGKKLLLPAVHEQYFRHFNSIEPHAARTDALEKRYKVYVREWDEISGHQDEFGLAVAREIFGTEESPRTRERVFWIVWYADDMMKFFGRIKKIWKSAGFQPAAE